MFSIIIPTYNQGHLLKKSLESVIKQTYQNWEAIVINNYSVDDTDKVINSFKDARIKSINFNNRGIIAASRNYGVRLSSYPYIAFLDSDDFWLPDKLEKSLHFLENGCNLVCHDEIWQWSDGFSKLIHYGPERDSNYESLLFKGNVLSTSAISLKKDLIIKCNGFNESPLMAGNEDYDLWMRMSLITRFKFIREPLGYYIIHENNTSKKILKQLGSEIHIIYYHFLNSKIKKDFFNIFKLIFRTSKAIVGSIIRSNQALYKLSIKIRK